MTQNSSIDMNRQLLYYTIRLQNSADDTLHAWMRHILAYLTSSTAGNEEMAAAAATAALTHNGLHNQLQHQAQEPHRVQNENCDGSCDCQTNTWVREISYEQHCRKLLMSRVNVGDTHLSSSVDEDSLRREASLVMESVNRAAATAAAALDVDGNAEVQPANALNVIVAAAAAAAAASETSPMDIDAALFGADSESEDRSSSSEWDFVMYDSDIESEDSLDDPTYKPCGSDLLKLGNEYTSDDEDLDDFFGDEEDEIVNLMQDETDADDEDECGVEDDGDEENGPSSNFTSASFNVNATNTTSSAERKVEILRQFNYKNDRLIGGGNRPHRLRLRTTTHSTHSCLQKMNGEQSVESAATATIDGCEYLYDSSDDQEDQDEEKYYGNDTWEERPSTN